MIKQKNNYASSNPYENLLSYDDKRFIEEISCEELTNEMRDLLSVLLFTSNIKLNEESNRFTEKAIRFN